MRRRIYLMFAVCKPNKAAPSTHCRSLRITVQFKEIKMIWREKLLAL